MNKNSKVSPNISKSSEKISKVEKTEVITDSQVGIYKV